MIAQKTVPMSKNQLKVVLSNESTPQFVTLAVACMFGAKRRWDFDTRRGVKIVITSGPYSFTKISSAGYVVKVSKERGIYVTNNEIHFPQGQAWAEAAETLVNAVGGEFYSSSGQLLTSSRPDAGMSVDIDDKVYSKNGERKMFELFMKKLHDIKHVEGLNAEQLPLLPEHARQQLENKIAIPPPQPAPVKPAVVGNPPPPITNYAKPPASETKPPASETKPPASETKIVSETNVANKYESTRITITPIRLKKFNVSVSPLNITPMTRSDVSAISGICIYIKKTLIKNNIDIKYVNPSAICRACSQLRYGTSRINTTISGANGEKTPNPYGMVKAKCTYTAGENDFVDDIVSIIKIGIEAGKMTSADLPYPISRPRRKHAPKQSEKQHAVQPPPQQKQTGNVHTFDPKKIYAKIAKDSEFGILVIQELLATPEGPEIIRKALERELY